MSTRLKQLGISLTIWLLRLIKALVQSLWVILMLLLNPFWIIAKVLFRPIVLFGYRQYLRVIARLKHSAFMQNKVLFLFGNKYFIHVLVATLTLFVTSANLLQAQSGYRTEFGTDSGLYKIVSQNSELGTTVTLVEHGLPKPKRHSYVNTAGVMVANIPNVNPAAKPPQTVGDQLRLAEGNSALVSSNILNTDVGIRSGITEYKIRDGDTISEIADRFGITVQTILLSNNLTSSSYIKPGNTLKILPISGISYVIASGDTLDKIIEKYKGNLDETVQINDIGEDHTIAVGKEIVIAGGTPPPPPPPPTTSYIASVGSSRYSSSAVGANIGSNLPNYITAGQFNYPVGCRGAMTTYWGHAGRGRDLPCPSGTPVYAATEGTANISYTGYGHGYGNAIDLYGPNGVMTRYGHMSAFAINSGQYVSRGQVIGYVGSTGWSTGPHLHFEIHINGVTYDPINYLR